MFIYYTLKISLSVIHLNLKMITITQEALDHLTNSPCQHLKKMYGEQYGEYAY